MKKDNKTICSYCGQRFNSDTMKYGLCSDCYEMIIRLGYAYESSIYWINWVFDRIDYKTGASTNASVSNQNAIACSLGINSRASGQLGSWLVLTEWKYNCKIKNNQLIKVRAVRVDGKKIKPGAWYKIENGQIVECEQNCYTPLTLII